MTQPKTGRFLTRLRAAATGDEGAANAFLVIAAVVVFGVISVSFGGGLQVAMTTMQQQKVNSALASRVNEIAMKEAARGYAVVSALPAKTDLTLTIAGAEVPAQRVVEVTPAAQTAKVTVRVGKYTKGAWENPAACDTTPTKCISATDVAAPTLAQSFPQTPGLTTINAATNIPASTEVAWTDIAVGLTTTVAVDSTGQLWSWGTNTNGEAGQNSITPVLAPTRITVPGTTFTAVAAGNTSMYAIDQAGKLWSWGADTTGQLGNGAAGAVRVPTKLTGTLTWKAISAGPGHACGVTGNGDLYCWGNGAGAWRAGTAVAQAPVRLFAAGESAADASTTRFADVSVGGTHQAAIDASGDIYTWGTDGSGQLGNGAPTAAVTVPTQVTSPAITAMAVEVETSTNSTYIVDAYGRMYAWGANTVGQLGDGTLTLRDAPVRVASNILFRQVNASASTAYGVSRDGVLYAWGRGADGALGGGSDTNRTSPAPVTDDATFAAVHAARTGTASTPAWAVDSTARLWAWGSGTAGAFGDGKNTAAVRADAQQNRIRTAGGVTVTGVAAGANHTAALGDDGNIWSWGANTDGQLGNGATTATGTPVKATAVYTDQPVNVTAGDGHILVTGTLGRVVGSGLGTSGELTGTASRTAPAAAGTGQYSQVATGGSHTVAINRANGTVVAWGKNTYGQLGDGTTTNATAPVAVKGLPAGVPIVEVAAGAAFSAALDINGNVWTWGRNDYAQIGDGSTATRTTAVKVPLTAKVTTIGAGAAHMLAVDVAGKVWAWGRNDRNQLGTGTASDRRAIPVAVTTPGVLAAVDGADFHSVGVTTAGKLISWGGEAAADNGHGNITTTTPTVIAAPAVTAATFREVVATARQTLAIDTDGDLWVWGTDASGRLGRATTATPVELVTGKHIIAADTSATNSVYVTADGSVAVTGTGANGQLGRSTQAASGTFIDVPAWAAAVQANTPTYAKTGTVWAAPTFTAVDARDNVTAAVDENGHLWAWGAGDTGQTGTGKLGNRATPTLVASTVRFAEVAVSGKHLVARGADGTVWAFGRSSTGANSRGIAVNVPVRVPVMEAAAHVGTGANHSTALAVGGKTVYAWGRNDNGQLGIPASGDQVTPVKTTVPATGAIAVGDGYTVLRDTAGAVTVWGTAPWGDAPNPFTGTYSDVRVTGQVVVAAQRNATNTAQVFGVATAGTPATSLATVTVSRFTNIDASAGHVVALDANGTVWTWGANSSGQLGRAGAATTPALVPTVGNVSVAVLSAQDAPARATTIWKVASITASAPASVQVNIRAGIPLKSVIVLCADGSQKQMAPAAPSSGDFSYANITLESTAGCGSPTLAAILDGAPANVAQVTVVVIPLVYADDLDTTW